MKFDHYLNVDPEPVSFQHGRGFVTPKMARKPNLEWAITSAYPRTLLRENKLDHGRVMSRSYQGAPRRLLGKMAR